jgi:hypothetical protein
MAPVDLEALCRRVLGGLDELRDDFPVVLRHERIAGRREGGEKAIFHALCLIERLPVRDPLPGESPAEYMGAWKALVEAQLHRLAEQIEAGQINLTPLPRPSDKSGGRMP